MTFKLSGLKELDAALGEMKKATAKGIMRRAAMAALEPMRDMAQSLAPVDDGQLRDSIGISSTLIKSARRKGGGSGQTAVAAYVGTANPNGVRSEYGTYKQAAKPFMAPAFEATAEQVLHRVADSLRTEIDKAAKPAAKRKAKG